MSTMPSPTTNPPPPPSVSSSLSKPTTTKLPSTNTTTMDQTPKHRNTSSNNLSTDTNNGNRRFPGMRSAAPPPDYTSRSQLRPTTTTAAMNSGYNTTHHHRVDNHYRYHPHEGYDYDEYTHDLTAPLPEYDVPYHSHHHHSITHHHGGIIPQSRSSSRERVMPREYLHGRHPPPHPHHYYRPPQQHGYYEYYDGPPPAYYREHHDYHRAAAGESVGGGGKREGRYYEGGSRLPPSSGAAGSGGGGTNGGTPSGFDREQQPHQPINNKNSNVTTSEENTGNHQEQQQGTTTKEEEEGKSLRAVSGSFSVTASNSSETVGKGYLSEEQSLNSAEVLNTKSSEEGQKQVSGSGADEKDKDIAVVLASMDQDGSVKNSSVAVDAQEEEAEAANNKSSTPKAAPAPPSSSSNNNRNDDLEVTSSISQSPDDHPPPHGGSNHPCNIHNPYSSSGRYHHPHHQVPLSIRKKKPTPSKLHYMAYPSQHHHHPHHPPHPQYYPHPQHHHSQQRGGRHNAMMAPPPVSTHGHHNVGYAVDEDSPSASTISTKASQFMSVTTVDNKKKQKKGEQALSESLKEDECRSDVEVVGNNDDDDEHEQDDQEEDEGAPPPMKRQRRSNSNASFIGSTTGGGGADAALQNLSSMPSWETTRSSGPGTISGWSVCSNLASGTACAANGKEGEGGGASPAERSRVSAKEEEGSDVLLNAPATSPTDGDSLYRSGVLSAFSFSSDNFGRTNGGASSTFSIPSAGVGAGGGEDDISPKSILSKDGKNKKSMPQGTHVQFSRDGEEGSSGTSSGRKRMAPHLSRSGYDDYYDYPPTSRYHHAPPPPPPPGHHHHPYYDSPTHHHRSMRYHPDDAYYAESHYHHSYPPHPHHPRGGTGGGGYNARHHYHHGPPPSHPPGGHYYDRHSHHDFPPSPSPTHHHRQYLHGGPLEDSLRGVGSMEGVSSASSGSASRRTPRSSSTSLHSRDDLPMRMANFPNPHGWTKEEDTALITIMKGSKKNPQSWSPIGHQLGRSPDDCRERWTRFLKPGARKGQWTEEEDNAVIKAVQSAGPDGNFTRWSELASHLPGRVGKQVRDRWVNHLNPNINHLPFSKEDDLLLWEGHSKVGKRWVEISSTFFKGTRSENHIKNRWYSASFKKFITSEFGEDSFVNVSKTQSV